VYDGELERMNASLAAENQTLQHDNKQLGALIREYEQTLESVMSAFRTRAVRVYIHVMATHSNKNMSSFFPQLDPPPYTHVLRDN
jgi:hypothetical protein